MKISKLFHWLYAILMLLPFLVFLPNAFYYGFNEHAVAQEKTEQVPVYYPSNDVNELSDVLPDHVYYWNNDFHPTTDINYTVGNIILTENLYQFNNYFIIGNTYTLYYTGGNHSLYIVQGSNHFINLHNRSTYLLFLNLNDNVISQAMVEHLSDYSNQVIKEYQPMTTTMSITDSMSYAWDSVWQNDLFSWSYGSFLTEPFIYIGNVFNVPVDNTLYYALSYWLDISIIWLTFDLLMYVPLLVHRWVDKGIVE